MCAYNDFTKSNERKSPEDGAPAGAEQKRSERRTGQTGAEENTEIRNGEPRRRNARRKVVPRNPLPGTTVNARARRRSLKLRTLLWSLVTLVLVLFLTVALYINSMLNKINFVDSDYTWIRMDPSEADKLTDPDVDYPTETDETEPSGTGDEGPENPTDPGATEAPAPQIAAPFPQDQLRSSSSVKNILLIGSDTRQPGYSARSDVMILLSIDSRNGKLTMSSLLRDIYVNIPGGYKPNRLNAANAFGGPPLLLETIRNNFRVDVQKFMMVDFFSFRDIVDALGGVTIDVKPEEVEYVNFSVREMNNLEGRAADAYWLKVSGKVNLNGLQAVGYSRIRKIGSDFGRTQRQRNVLNAILAKFRSADIGTLHNTVNAVLPYLTTNLSRGDVLDFAAQLPAIVKYPVTELQIPAKGTFENVVAGSHGGVIKIDLYTNNRLLWKTIYGE